ncbi:SMP-30/gluconolactonase/LRE family protein [Nonlabens agnitus]|uniref:SMP-30/gluconolactonase/LRE family protein n=1 Tax=Nonlabens agnitus TaxID=870484 RepID=UPI0015598E97|nr:SMP-30/gluconolactonase/LRE family protein [Nonlabens agnitus]
MRCLLFILPVLFFSCKNENQPEKQLEIPQSENEVKTYQAELAYEYKAQLGEGALWDAATQRLYWIDIFGKELHVFDPVTHTDKTYDTGSVVGTVVSVNDEKVMVALVEGIFSIDLTTGAVELFSDTTDTEVPGRFNDGKVDPNGNFWVGSMPWDQEARMGKLYKIDGEGNATVMLTGIGISNGIVWAKDKSTMYSIDTKLNNVRAFDYDVATSTISNERVVVEVPEELGNPDGMAIDENDQLWIGLWNGGIVAHYDPKSGELLSKIEVPAHNVTSCAFGGENLDELYITTATQDMTDEEIEKYPLAGSVFVVKPGVQGVKSAVFGKSN